MLMLKLEERQHRGIPSRGYQPPLPAGRRKAPLPKAGSRQTEVQQAATFFLKPEKFQKARKWTHWPRFSHSAIIPNNKGQLRNGPDFVVVQGHQKAHKVLWTLCFLLFIFVHI